MRSILNVILMTIPLISMGVQSHEPEFNSFYVGIEEWHKETVLISLCINEADFSDYILKSHTVSIGWLSRTDFNASLTERSDKAGITRYEFKLNPSILKDHTEVYIVFNFTPINPDDEVITIRYHASEILSKVEKSEIRTECGGYKKMTPTNIGVGSYSALG